MSAYVLFHYNIKDCDRINELGPLADSIVKNTMVNCLLVITSFP